MIQLLKSEKFGTAAKSGLLDEAIKAKKVVLRSFLTTGANLKQSMESRGLDPELESAYRHYSFPHFIWITEIHIVANYPNFCIGQVVWDATASSRDAQGFLFLHYPNVLFMNTTPHFNRAGGPLPGDVCELVLQMPSCGFTTFRPFSRNLSPF